MGWGGYLYVEDEKGKRITCPHPCEWGTITDVLGKNASKELIEERVGFNSYCVCLDCMHQFEADLRDKSDNPWSFYYTISAGLDPDKKKDRRECPKCASPDIRTVFEMIGQLCPKCEKGTIEEIETGIIS